MTTNPKHHRPAGDGSIYKDEKRGRWIAQLRVGYDGRTGRSIKRTRACLTQKEARQALDDLREKYANQAAVLADHMTVKDWLLRWFETYSKPKIRPSTAAGYDNMLQIAIDALGRRPLDELTSYELQTLINTRMRSHFRTAQFFRAVIRMAFQRAVRLKLIRENPADDLELPRKPPRKPFVRPTKKDRETLLAADTIYYCWRQILLTEFMTGLRRGELLGLHWTDINLDEGWLRVRYSLTNGKREPDMAEKPIFLSEPKTATSKRQIFIPPALCKELAAYKARQSAMRLRAEDWQHPDLVFTFKNGRYINPSVFSSQYCKIRRKLGIKTTFHMLRHDMASRMKASHKFDFKDIQEQLGHSTIQITMDIYTHIDEQQKTAVSSWLEDDVSNIIDMGEKIQNRKAR